MSTQFLLVDDHKIIRMGLCSLINSQPGWEVCGETGDGLKAIDLAIKLRPDVVIMDIGMPKLDGAEATKSICTKVPGVKVVALSVHQEATFVVSMLRAGAKGYVPKVAAHVELVTAIKTVLKNMHYVSPIVTGFVLEQFILDEKDKECSGIDLLTPTEKQVLIGVALGRQSKEIAEESGVSHRTINTHRRSIMKKLGASGIADLTRLAIQFGLIDIK
jgi:DNA-binding NarL/FixJ family response regulator